MKYVYGKQDFADLKRGQENCYLMTNGLGGFSSLTMVGSCSRADHGVLISCEREEAPNHRWQMIHRMQEKLECGKEQVFLSSQETVEAQEQEEGFHYQTSFTYEDYPCWNYLAMGVEVRRKLILCQGENRVGISYEIHNRSGSEISLQVTPYLLFVPKGALLEKDTVFKISQDSKGHSRTTGQICANDRVLFYQTNGQVEECKPQYRDGLYYSYDACDGRRETGGCMVNHHVRFRVKPGEAFRGILFYGTEPAGACVEEQWQRCERELVEYGRELCAKAGLADETAQALVKAASQFLSYRASTGQQTILAGFPFFEDWGRDTMIALTGCCLSTGQFETAKSILRTFMKYCRKGLMPNLFPEGAQEPMYNTADAALLFLLAVYEYYERTKDLDFVEQCYGVMEEIVACYHSGTDYQIAMDGDGLVRAGSGYDQVTWMDVRVGDILPTPRHGKPVEINAYWYNGLCIMEQFRILLKRDKGTLDYAAMAEHTKKSFREKFWNPKENCLKDVLSGTDADEQVRCNQIWAVSMPFSLLERDREKLVVEAVFCTLYTPLGLRTLSPQDKQFRPSYGGELLQRDLAYHQGTVWVYPLGAYYLAYLKVHDNSCEAAEKVAQQLEAIEAALREGCIGQLPEIYDGQEPVFSRGCFAQAWSVGELLRVYEKIAKKQETKQ